jgi:hypothetical protein
LSGVITSSGPQSILTTGGISPQLVRDYLQEAEGQPDFTGTAAGRDTPTRPR